MFVSDLTEAVSASSENVWCEVVEERASGSGPSYAYDLRELWSYIRLVLPSTENSSTFASLCGKPPSDVGSVDGSLWMMLMCVVNS